MARSSKDFVRQIVAWFRRVFGKYVRELSQTGRVVRTLWDAAQMQQQQRHHYRRMGEIALQLYKEGKLQDERLERGSARIEQADRILTRQELVLKSYQQRGDIKEVLREFRRANRDRLEKMEPV